METKIVGRVLRSSSIAIAERWLIRGYGKYRGVTTASTWRISNGRTV